MPLDLKELIDCRVNALIEQSKEHDRVLESLIFEKIGKWDSHVPKYKGDFALLRDASMKLVNGGDSCL